MKYSSPLKQASLILGSVAIVFLASGVAYAAWSDPQCNPTDPAGPGPCNTATPINVSGTAQNKEGFLGLGVAPERRLHVNGTIGISNRNFLDLGLGVKSRDIPEIGKLHYVTSASTTPNNRQALKIFGGRINTTDPNDPRGRRLIELFDDVNVFGTISTCTGPGSCSPVTGGGDSLWQRIGTTNNISNKLDGNVGIGTTTPNYKLTVNGIISASGLLMSRNDSPSLVLFDTNNSSVNARIQVEDNLLSFNRVSSRNSIAATPLSINLNSGNVGVGTVVDPTLFKLQVYGSVGPHLDNKYNLGSPTRRWANLYASNIYKCSGPNEDDCIEVTNNTGGDSKWASSTNQANIYNKNLTGNVGVGTANPQTKFHIKTGIVNILFSNGGADGTDAIIAANKDGGSSASLTFLSNRYKFGANGEMLMIAPGGNVGIGNMAPTSRLQVNGTTRVDGSLTAFGTLLSSGQIIGENAAPSILLNQNDQTDKNVRMNVQDSIFRISKVTSPAGTNPGNSIISSPFIIDLVNDRVGIGAASPATKLQVNGTIGVDGNNISASELGRLQFGAFNLEGKDVGYIRYKNTSPQSLDVYGGVVVAEGVPMQPRLIRLFDDVNIAGKLTVNRICTTGGVCFDTSSVGGGPWATSGNNIYNTNTGTVGIGVSTVETGYKTEVAGALLVGAKNSNGGRIAFRRSSSEDPTDADTGWSTGSYGYAVGSATEVLAYNGSGGGIFTWQTNGNNGVKERMRLTDLGLTIGDPTVGTAAADAILNLKPGSNQYRILGNKGNTGGLELWAHDLPTGGTPGVLRKVMTVFGYGNNGAGYVEVEGTVKIKGGEPGLSKVLTSDASGGATWKDNKVYYDAITCWWDGARNGLECGVKTEGGKFFRDDAPTNTTWEGQLNCNNERGCVLKCPRIVDTQSVPFEAVVGGVNCKGGTAPSVSMPVLDVYNGKIYSIGWKGNCGAAGAKDIEVMSLGCKPRSY
ncbi:MAG: hypothetical protein QG665_346 [Patescibacteria group bacterium]|nr:hypothetical protein [Patescibacteria group bacterium]